MFMSLVVDMAMVVVFVHMIVAVPMFGLVFIFETMALIVKAQILEMGIGVGQIKHRRR